MSWRQLRQVMDVCCSELPTTDQIAPRRNTSTSRLTIGRSASYWRLRRRVLRSSARRKTAGSRPFPFRRVGVVICPHPLLGTPRKSPMRDLQLKLSDHFGQVRTRPTLIFGAEVLKRLFERAALRESFGDEIVHFECSAPLRLRRS